MLKKFILFFILTLSFISCANDNPNNPNESTSTTITLQDVKNILNGLPDIKNNNYTFVFKDQFNNLSANNSTITIAVSGTGIQDTTKVSAEITANLEDPFISKKIYPRTSITTTSTVTGFTFHLSPLDSNISFADDIKFALEGQTGIKVQFSYQN